MRTHAHTQVMLFFSFARVTAHKTGLEKKGSNNIVKWLNKKKINKNTKENTASEKSPTQLWSPCNRLLLESVHISGAFSEVIIHTDAIESTRQNGSVSKCAPTEASRLSYFNITFFVLMCNVHRMSLCKDDIGDSLLDIGHPALRSMTDLYSLVVGQLNETTRKRAFRWHDSQLIFWHSNDN